MHKEQNDIIGIKPSMCGISIDVRALARRLFSKKNTEPAIKVAERFLQIFKDHGISQMQIPRFIPEISIDNLRDIGSLLPVLTDDVVNKCAKLFNIRRTWLEGVEDQIYDCHWCYTDPGRFFEDIAAVKPNGVLFPVIALSTEKSLDRHSRRKQPIVICLVERIAELDDKEIRRYTIFNDGWDWSYPKARIQLKALVRALSRVGIPVVPIYRIAKKNLKKIESGHCVPRLYLEDSRLHRVSLEDYVRSSEESAVAKETDELPVVIECIDHYNLKSPRLSPILKKCSTQTHNNILL
ncbi:MAG: hypothetical protein PHD72_03030 [Patescibacteria group bacterium]|nr:hypothetical protein [Patescibacteria group bacterium]